MALLEILHFPDPRLRRMCQPIDDINDDIRVLATDMLETMYEAPGIGLAAAQVNVQKRLLVVDVSEDKNEPLVFINPEILEKNGVEVMQEGCLSVPGFYEDVERADSIKVKAFDQHGNEFTLGADGLLAVCIQHEIDHLDGKLFVDYISPFKRQRIKTKLEKQKRKGLLEQPSDRLQRYRDQSSSDPLADKGSNV